MKLLITGAAGFLGSNLADSLIGSHHIAGIDNFDPFYDRSVKETNIKGLMGNSKFSFYEMDLLNPEKLDDLLTTHSVDMIIHLAAKAGVRPSILDPVGYTKHNIEATVNILEAARIHNIRNIILASSSSVYGNNTKVPFSESDNVDFPISPYAASKKACELFCYAYHHLYDIRIACLRFFTVYGPRQRPEMAIHKFTRLIDHGKEIEMYGDGASRRDYTYISDIVEGIIATLDKKIGYEVINLGNSSVVELRYLIRLIEENLGKEARIKQLPDQPGDVPVTYADISKAKRLLGYNPRVGIEEGVERFVGWYGEQT